MSLRRSEHNPCHVLARSWPRIEVAGAKTRSLLSFRHELCEQIQRLGGVVTISELIGP